MSLLKLLPQRLPALGMMATGAQEQRAKQAQRANTAPLSPAA